MEIHIVRVLYYNKRLTKILIGKSYEERVYCAYPARMTMTKINRKDRIIIGFHEMNYTSKTANFKLCIIISSQLHWFVSV